MGRWVPALLALAALAGVVFLPEVSRARLACLSAHELLGARVLDGEGGEPRTLAELVLDGPAARKKPDGGVELSLYGVRLAADAGARAEMTMNIVLRRSIVRGLRQFGGEEHEPLSFVGEEAPRAGAGGASSSSTTTRTRSWSAPRCGR